MTPHTTPHTWSGLLCAAAWLALGGVASGSGAAQAAPREVFASSGGATAGTVVTTLGIGWPGDWRREILGGEVSGQIEAFVAHWSVPAGSGREAYTQVGLLPLLRYRFARGHAAWFAEGGIGVSMMDSRLQTPSKTMGLRFNFYDVLAVGRSFGAERKHELSLRLAHVSNGGLGDPNPGEELLQLRYLRRF